MKIWMDPTIKKPNKVLKKNYTKSLISLRKMFENVNIDEDDGPKVLSIKENNDILDMGGKKSKIDEESVILLRAFGLNENELKVTMETLRNSELKRINREFLANDYHRRFSITQEDVISTLVGEDGVTQEFNKMMREGKVYFEQLKSCRSYSVIQMKGQSEH